MRWTTTTASRSPRRRAAPSDRDGKSTGRRGGGEKFLIWFFSPSPRLPVNPPYQSALCIGVERNAHRLVLSRPRHVRTYTRLCGGSGDRWLLYVDSARGGRAGRFGWRLRRL